MLKERVNLVSDSVARLVIKMDEILSSEQKDVLTLKEFLIQLFPVRRC